jgi:hypothetical protein
MVKIFHFLSCTAHYTFGYLKTIFKPGNSNIFTRTRQNMDTVSKSIYNDFQYCRIVAQEFEIDYFWKIRKLLALYFHH